MNTRDVKLTLNQLYATVKKKRGQAKILSSIIVGTGQMSSGEPVLARIVFVRDRRTKKKWLALLSTDTELPDEEVIRIYGKRWNIEVFFKMPRSCLRLAKEFQGRSCDSMVAHTAIVFIRYVMLALESRNGEDPSTIGNLFYIYEKEVTSSVGKPLFPGKHTDCRKFIRLLALSVWKVCPQGEQNNA